ncbi:MAG: hypothetical protein Q4A58_00765 [Fusobacterium sp.]|uniref:hypothetical protein n=1 Tax=Fusobacterium sp. TaxID=68766 RepID=UPI0026DB8C1F|nr:hypothetical protein [Fusobacterium sp.]MDO4689813.1 hypothetical protein [Fusobacterium sp.]
MKKMLLGLLICLFLVSCGKKEVEYPIYTKAEKEAIYKEAKDKDNKEKLKEIEDLMNKLEILGKNGDKVAEGEYLDWEETQLFYRAPKQKDPGANLLDRKW